MAHPRNSQGNGAVVYVRVSTDEQAEDPLNLEKQEARCRDFCVQKSTPVRAVFVDAGESARTVDRPEFQRMLAYCRAHRNDIGFVVVQDLSRFARNVQDQGQTIAELGCIGIKLRSTYETNIDESPEGKMGANMLGSINQYFSDSLSVKMRGRTRQSVAAGRYPWRAPIGYKNIGGKEGPNIKPDEDRAPLIRRAFELMATGLNSKAEVLQIVTSCGLTTAKGKPLSKQTLQAVLRNPLYAGWVTLPSVPDFEPVRGLHTAIVRQETFDRVQSILAGRRPSVVAKQKINPLLPLKWFVKCGACGTPLTGGAPQGRGKKTYPRYWCRNPKCRAVSLSRSQLENEFLEVLGRLRAAPETIAEFPNVAAKVWAARHETSEWEIERLTERLDGEKTLLSKLLRMRARGEMSAEEYEREKGEITAQIYEYEEQVRDLTPDRSAIEFVHFAQLKLVDMASAWKIAEPEQRQRVQNLLFNDGLDYSPERGILNRSNSSLYSMLEAMKPENGWLVGPPGLEPGTNGL